MKIITVILIIECLFFIGCSKEPPLDSGVVISKKHQLEKTWVQVVLIPRVVRTGKASITSLTPISMLHRRPEHWSLIIEGRIEFKGKRLHKQRELYISRETYERILVGDTYVVQPNDKLELQTEKHRASNEEKLVYGVQPSTFR